MNLKSIIVIIVFPFLSCLPLPKYELSDCWRLDSVERINCDYPGLNRILQYPDKPHENKYLVFSEDSDYQIWSWKDKWDIKFIIKFEGSEYEKTKSFEYSIEGDSLKLTTNKFKYKITGDVLTLEGIVRYPNTNNKICNQIMKFTIVKC